MLKIKNKFESVKAVNKVSLFKDLQWNLHNSIIINKFNYTQLKLHVFVYEKCISKITPTGTYKNRLFLLKKCKFNRKQFEKSYT